MTSSSGRGGGRQAAKDKPQDSRVPPHDLEAEQSLIGAMLIARQAIIGALEVGLTADEFYKPAHAHIYAAITALHAAGQPADVVTVAAELQRAGVIDQVTTKDDAGAAVTGRAALLVFHAPATSNAAKYARIIRDHAARRKMLAQTAEIVEELYSGRIPNGTLHQLTDLAEEARRGGKIAAIDLVWGEPETPPQPQPVLIHGMLRAGELCVIAAPRGIGKTFFTYNLAKLLASGTGKLMGTLAVERPARVLLCQGELEEWQSHARWQMIGGKPVNVAETWAPWRIRVQRHRRPNSDGGWDEWTDAQVDEGLEQAIVDHGVEVLVIDPWRTYYAGSENSNDEVEQALTALTAMARRTGIALVIVHHISGKTDPSRVIEPEDLWRGATRLPDWASTRVTILPHYSAKAAEEAGLSRNAARRHVDVHFLRRAEPTDDFCAVLNGETGWWERWEGGVPGAGHGRGKSGQATGSGALGGPGLPDVAEHYVWLVERCASDGGDWTSLKQACAAIGKGSDSTSKLLTMAVRHGLLDEYPIGNRKGWRLPQRSPAELQLETNFEPDAPPVPTDIPPGHEPPEER